MNEHSNVIPFRPRQTQSQTSADFAKNRTIRATAMDRAEPTNEACPHCGETIDATNPRATLRTWADEFAMKREFGKARLAIDPGCLWCVRARASDYAIHILKSGRSDSAEMLRNAEHVVDVLADLLESVEPSQV